MKTKLLLLGLFFIYASFPIVSSAQSLLFDFDSAPLYTSLPISQTTGSVTAHLYGTGNGYSIQDANVLGFTPAGFAGHVIYPNSINLADLLVHFNQPITDFSIMYSCQELACDDAATMRVTAFMNGNYVGTNTKCTAHPGTWPVDTLACSFAAGFDSVVVHYDSHPPTCADYGVIFLADNMRVTPFNPSAVSEVSSCFQKVIIPNPVSSATTISFFLSRSESINVSVYDITGKFVSNLLDGTQDSGEHVIHWNINDDAYKNGVYFLKLSDQNFSTSYKIVVIK